MPLLVPKLANNGSPFIYPGFPDLYSPDDDDD